MLLGFAALAALSRPLWMPGLPAGALVEVTGDVPRPGTYLVDPPTVAGAVAAAGGSATEDMRLVPGGHRVVVGPEGLAIEPPGDPLLVGLPVDPNTASAAALDAIPGVDAREAVAIVAEREAGGPFRVLADLRRVPGLGPAAIEGLKPFVTLGEGEATPSGPIDLNRASAAELERLPGIGPVTAARIVVDREERGPYTAVEDLDRVRGIGPATLERLAPLVEVRP